VTLRYVNVAHYFRELGGDPREERIVAENTILTDMIAARSPRQRRDRGLARELARPEPLIAKNRQVETTTTVRSAGVYFLPSMARASLQTVLTAARSLLLAFS